MKAMEKQEDLEISQKQLNEIFHNYHRYKEDSVYKFLHNDSLKRFVEEEMEAHLKDFILMDRFTSEGYQKAKRYFLWHERIADDSLKSKLKEIF